MGCSCAAIFAAQLLPFVVMAARELQTWILVFGKVLACATECPLQSMKDRQCQQLTNQPLLHRRQSANFNIFSIHFSCIALVLMVTAGADWLQAYYACLQPLLPGASARDLSNVAWALARFSRGPARDAVDILGPSDSAQPPAECHLPPAAFREAFEGALCGLLTAKAGAGAGAGSSTQSSKSSTAAASRQTFEGNGTAAAVGGAAARSNGSVAAANQTPERAAGAGAAAPVETSGPAAPVAGIAMAVSNVMNGFAQLHWVPADGTAAALLRFTADNAGRLRPDGIVNVLLAATKLRLQASAPPGLLLNFDLNFL